jgi:flagellar biosynthesis chaperone FliJ
MSESPLKEAIERVRKRLEELTTDIHETVESTHSLIKTARPKPLRTFMEKKLERIRPLKRLREERQRD